MTTGIWGRYALALACVSMCRLAAAQESPATQPAAAPRLKLSTQEWDFGEAWQGEPLSKEIAVKNTGDAPLEILDVKSSCGCTVPTKPKSPLAPGESSSLTISYNSTNRVGAANHTVTLTTNDPAQPSVGIKLTGTVKAAYDIDPRDGLMFGQLYQSSEETRKIEITNKYTDKMTLKLKEGQEFGPFLVQLKEVEPGMRYTLTATTKPPLKVGRFQADVELLTGIERVPSIKSVVYGFVQPPVAVRPTKVFAPKNAISERKQVLRVSHAPDQPIEVTGVKSSLDAIKVEFHPLTQPASIALGPQEYQIVVTLPPGDLLPDGAAPTIEITTDSNDPQYQKLVVPIQIIPGPQLQPQAATTMPAATATQPAPAARPAPVESPKRQ